MFLPKGSRYIACVQLMMRFYFLNSVLCPWPLLKCIIGRARIVWGAGSMKRYGVRLSVCLSQHGRTAANTELQVCCCGPGGQEISIDCCSIGVRRANAGSSTLSAYVCS